MTPIFRLSWSKRRLTSKRKLMRQGRRLTKALGLRTSSALPDDCLIRSGALTPEPFLIVGLIASIRNVLVITLKSSGVTSEGHGSIEGEMLLRSSIVELGVLGALILIFVVSIYLLRRGHALRAANARQADQDRSPRAGE